MNTRLTGSASPYLRAHASNPVAWYPWGEEAFAHARERDVPVLVSLGYSTCHWCHVMARESFADDEIAALINERLVAIKVDREEHPEVDAAYLEAAAAFTGSLGWPLTVFTDPAGRPFYAGTYFPPEPRSGVPSFRQVLDAVEDAWTQRREEVDVTAAAVASALAETRGTATVGGVLPTTEDLARVAGGLAAREDPQYGGFSGGGPHAPKFPLATGLRFLQAPAVRHANPAASAVADRALASMVASPLRDDVEGGFFRYATRPDWTVPHYERMLTDNAQLLDVATDAGDAPTAAGVAGFLIDILRRPSGGFGAAQDSESWIDGTRSEGGYYERAAASRALLQPPAVDAKVVTGWNGLAIGALARAGARWDESGWIDDARAAAEAVIGVGPDDLLIRASLDGIPSTAAATLADYGQFAGGLIALAVATGEVAYAERARRLVIACLTPAGDLRTPGGGDAVLAGQGMQPAQGASDGDEPSGPSAVADAAVALWMLGADIALRRLAERVVARHAERALAQPLAHGALLRVAALLASPPRQLVVVGDDRGGLLVDAARALKTDVLALVTSAQATQWAAEGFALFDGKVALDGASTAYDCRDFACRLPTTEVSGLIA